MEHEFVQLPFGIWTAVVYVNIVLVVCRKHLEIIRNKPTHTEDQKRERDPLKKSPAN